jgi:hypothetical protein
MRLMIDERAHKFIFAWDIINFVSKIIMRSTRSVQAVKDANDGEIPNNLYLQKTERLCELIFDLTGEERPKTDSIKVLATLIEEILPQINVSSPVEPESPWATKRKADEISIESNPSDPSVATGEVSLPKTTKKGKVIKPRWAVDSLDALNIAEMKRILFLDPQTLYDRYQAKDLMQMWDYMGMKTQYPTGWETSKFDTIERMKVFAGRNLIYHKVPNVTHVEK